MEGIILFRWLPAGAGGGEGAVAPKTETKDREYCLSTCLIAAHLLQITDVSICMYFLRFLKDLGYICLHFIFTRHLSGNTTASYVPAVRTHSSIYNIHLV